MCDMGLINSLAGEASPAAANRGTGPAATTPRCSQSRAISSSNSSSSSSRCQRRHRRPGAAGSQAGQAASRAPRSAAGARRCSDAPASRGAYWCRVTATSSCISTAGRRAADAVDDLAAHRQDLVEHGGAGSGATGPAARAEHLERLGPDQCGASGFCPGLVLSSGASNLANTRGSGPQRPRVSGYCKVFGLNQGHRAEDTRTTPKMDLHKPPSLSKRPAAGPQCICMICGDCRECSHKPLPQGWPGPDPGPKFIQLPCPSAQSALLSLTPSPTMSHCNPAGEGQSCASGDPAAAADAGHRGANDSRCRHSIVGGHRALHDRDVVHPAGQRADLLPHGASPL